MATKAKLNEDQQDAFKALQKFIEHPAADTFVLKGYAGTGKTFLMQYFAKWLEEKKYKFSLLASTGRAAAVLRGKTGLTTKTLHGELYHFSKLEGDDDDELPDDAPVEQHGQMSLVFALRPPDEAKMIYIIDESSMLSSELSEDTTIVSFGSGNLLSDFFAAAGNNKIIFVGDPGQLPPIKQIFSPALEMTWLADQRRIAVSVTLNKIERNEADNDILILADNVRSMNDWDSHVRYPKLPCSNLNNVTMYSTDKELFDCYVRKFKEKGANGTIAIARSNKMVQDINRAVRRDLFGQIDLQIEDSDILLVVQNNYAIPLTNGDFVSVIKLGEKVEQGGLFFQNIEIKTLLSDTEHDMLISLDILYGAEPNYTKDQQKRLMVDFKKRMKKKGISFKSKEFKAAMLTDPFLNCIRAKYGYAVTCHKAQGGEWDDVFLFLESKMYGMSKPELFRWWYTAITRTRIRLHIAKNWWIV